MKRLIVLAGLLLFTFVQAQSCEDGFRLFESDLLTTESVCIPEVPERVAYLIYASYLYPFGIKPIGSWGVERDASNFPAIAGWIREGFTDIGMPPNLETLTNLAPELIIVPDTRVTEITDELPLIAPTVIYNEGANWRNRHLMLGDIFGQRRLAEAQLAEADRRIAELAEAVSNSRGSVSDIRVALVRIFEPGDYYLASERYVPVEILRQVGFQIPEAVRGLEDWGVNFSDEGIEIANADMLIFIGSSGGEADQSLEGQTLVADLMANPLWNTLDAFGQKQVFSVGDTFQQSSLLAAHTVIDELAEMFNVSIPTPNPFAAAKTANGP